LILVLFQALKYIDGCLFLFPLGLARVLSTTRIATASLASVSKDTSSCCVSSSSSIVFPIFVGFCLLSLILFSPLLV